jgi:hypothetical protein
MMTVCLRCSMGPMPATGRLRARERVLRPRPPGDVDRARRNPSEANLSLFGNPYHGQIHELRERANILEPTSQD